MTKTPFFVSFSLGLLAVSLAQTNQQSTVHWQWRDLICETHGGDGPDLITPDKPAECAIALRDFEQDPPESRRVAQKNVGCFDEVVNGTLRTYCDLLCPGADTVYLIKRTPQVHRSCFVFYTHRLERRGQDWFLWRDKDCRHSRITFTIRCEFLFNRNEFPKDHEVFSRLDQPKKVLA